MLKKIVIGLLVLTVVGGAASALLDPQNAVSPETLSPTATPVLQPSTDASADAGTDTVIEQASTPQPLQQSINSVGELWSGSGTILDLTSVGMTMALEDGSEIYVELGSTEYWQSQPVTLNAGAVVTVDGFFNGTDYHARTVTTSDGAILALRNEAGQPLWSGGSGSGSANGSGETGGQGQVQIPADEWVTLDAAVTALTNNGLVVQTTDAQTLTVSFGRADFWQTQATTFAVGDAISMLGFWQADQFQVGQVTKTATGERILLRDPNGRPLWAGPGRGQGNSGGNSSGTGSSTGTGTANSTANGNGNGNGSGNGTANSSGSGNGAANSTANGNGSGTGTGNANSRGNGNGSGNGNAANNGNGNSNGSGNQYRGQRQQTVSTQQP